MGVYVYKILLQTQNILFDETYNNKLVPCILYVFGDF